jgi:hypothetical protein
MLCVNARRILLQFLKAVEPIERGRETACVLRDIVCHEARVTA